MGLGLVTVSEMWVATARRQKLEQLDWIGAQFTQAIGSYYEATPGVVVKTYPKSLQDLLQDRRYASIRRHSRQIYANPFDQNGAWTLVLAPDGGIRGIRVSLQDGDTLIDREYVYRAQASLPANRK